MADTINDLYLEYVNSVGQGLENDRYFQYLYEMVQAGENTLVQNNRIMHKVVDEQWLTIIEESLDAINNIIDKPRRFIASKEEVVPVSLAKKITADSVRHLSMNTQFISQNDEGDIMPSRILNVTTEESYDLYENRFIYHLIQRLVIFIDKRTDVIFWSTGDEKRNTLSMHSKIDDAYEEIEYKVEMTIKNRQSFAENDSDNMQVFMRIDRIRRLTLALRESSFCSIMSGCAKVKSPIQRTNLMMKDPDYRTCYKLWQFLEGYDDVGYIIDARDTALEFDEEYLIQMYTNLITNYTVFKSILEEDERKLSEIPPTQHKIVKPKFVKQIQEEIVDDYDIPDVEIRKVIIEEVTQAQLDAEAKLEEELAKNKELEELQLSLEEQMQMLYQQLDTVSQLQMEAEENAQREFEEKEKALKRADEAEAACEEAKAKVTSTQEEAMQRIARIKEEAEGKLAAMRQNAANQVSAIQEETQKRLAAMQAEAEKRIADSKQSADAQVTAVKSEADSRIAEIELAAAERIKMTEQGAADRIAEIEADAAGRIETAETEANNHIKENDAATRRQIDELTKRYETELSRMAEQLKHQQAEAEELLASETKRIKDEASEQIAQLEESSKQTIQELEAKLQEEQTARKDAELIAELERENRKEAQTRAAEQEKARIAAEEKAEGNRLTKLLSRAINENREFRREQRLSKGENHKEQENIAGQDEDDRKDN